MRTIFKAAHSSWIVSNKTCHPNPTALVGNLLIGRGNVVEVVEVR